MSPERPSCDGWEIAADLEDVVLKALPTSPGRRRRESRWDPVERSPAPAPHPPDVDPQQCSGSEEEEPVAPEVKGTSIADGRFLIADAIGSGSYSEVHLATDAERSGERVAVKLEWQKAEKGNRLLAEAKLYETFAEGDGQVPKVLWHGSEGQYNIMVMDLLGPSLDDLFKAKGKRFSLKTVLLVAEQMISRIEFVHSCGVLHRDIKPHNFLMGLGVRADRVHVMDFGLSKRYLDEKTGKHIACAKRSGLTGTVRYTSLNQHKGYEPGRRDDLLSVGYVLMHFLLGVLPWQGITANSKKAKQKKIGHCKEKVSHEELCKGFPHELVEYFQHLDSLSFEDQPDYELLRRFMSKAFDAEGFERDGQFDWMLGDKPLEIPPPEIRPKVAAKEEVGRRAGGDERSRSDRRRKVATEPLEAEASEEYDYYEESEEETLESEESEEESEDSKDSKESKEIEEAKD